MKKNELVMAIGDMHTPFEHKDAYEFLKAVKRKEGPSKIVNLGDEIDAHAFAPNFDSDPDGFSPGAELERAIEHLEPHYRLFPNVRVCHSNHTARPYRKAFKYGLPKALFKGYREFLEAPKGWEWADKHTIDGVVYEHGEGQSGQNGAIRAALGNMQSTTIGHIHSFAGVMYNANPRHLIFGFNVGCLIDKDAYCFAYGKHMKNKPIIGVGLVERGVPRFLPMPLNKGGRWTGKLV